jgi:phage shock protein A
MNIFSRISDIIAAYINALLDKAEHSEAMIAQVVRAMEDGLMRAKGFGATAIALERRLGQDLEQHRGQASLWKERARTALVSSQEELARVALGHKIENEDVVRSLEAQCVRARQTSATVRTAIRALEAKLAEARRKQRTLISRNRAVRARAEATRFMDTRLPAMHASHSRFEELAARFEDWEDEQEARIELDQAGAAVLSQFASQEREQAIAAEVTALQNELRAEGK